MLSSAAVWKLAWLQETNKWAGVQSSHIHNFHMDAYTAISSVENKDDRSPSGIEKNGMTAIFMGRDPKPHVSDN